MRRADQIAGLALLVLGAGFAAGGLGYTYWGPGGPGSGFLPFWLGVALALLAALLVVAATRQGESGPPWLPGRSGLRRLGALLGTTTAFVAVLKVTGMAIGTVAFLLVVLRFIEGHAWRSSVTIALGVAALNYLVFTYWLRVPFPAGILGF